MISLFVVCIYLIFGAMSVVFWSCGFTNQQMMVFVFVFVVLAVVAVSGAVDVVFFLGKFKVSRKLTISFVGLHPQKKKRSRLRFKKM